MHFAWLIRSIALYYGDPYTSIIPAQERNSTSWVHCWSHKNYWQ